MSMIRGIELDENSQTIDDESDEQPSKRQKQNKKERKWKETDIDSYHDIAEPNELPAELLDSIKTPFDAFWNIYSDDLWDIITTQTKIYVNQYKGLNTPAISGEIKVAISILLLSGYFRVTYSELYWYASPDTHNVLVSKPLLRNRFREIFSNLHIWDNADIYDDCYYKVRPLFDILNINFKRFLSVKNFSVYERI